ncbi:DUF2878 domain-containing protein [Aliidiomarina indica]|uniref:DUF2878 domain-containing protein n=1 Tax=Aliidiomarina indica TaxID=2749147 RepID=UPI00188E2466|nr:DUF2878 domain-containing protein [Aliidiomarina indica]
MNPRIVAFVVFDFVWLSAVWGRESWLWLTALLIGLMFASAPKVLWQQRRAFFAILVVGLAIEWATVIAGVIQFTGTSGIPAWLYMLWIGFTGMALVVFDWLHRRYLLAAIAGAIFGPVTYLAGARFGAAELLLVTPAIIAVYAIAWALLMIFIAHLVNPEALKSRK